VLAAMNHIARQTSKPKWQPPAEKQQRSSRDTNRAKYQQRPSKFAKRIHFVILNRASCEVKTGTAV
jgi:hypothetical protein